jgi:hypothetical protein
MPVGTDQFIAWNVFYRGAERMPYKVLIGRRPMSAFFKNYPEWG